MAPGLSTIGWKILQTSPLPLNKEDPSSSNLGLSQPRQHFPSRFDYEPGLPYKIGPTHVAAYNQPPVALSPITCHLVDLEKDRRNRIMKGGGEIFIPGFPPLKAKVGLEENLEAILKEEGSAHRPADNPSDSGYRHVTAGHCDHHKCESVAKHLNFDHMMEAATVVKHEKRSEVAFVGAVDRPVCRILSFIILSQCVWLGDDGTQIGKLVSSGSDKMGARQYYRQIIRDSQPQLQLTTLVAKRWGGGNPASPIESACRKLAGKAANGDQVISSPAPPGCRNITNPRKCEACSPLTFFSGVVNFGQFLNDWLEVKDHPVPMFLSLERLKMGGLQLPEFTPGLRFEKRCYGETYKQKVLTQIPKDDKPSEVKSKIPLSRGTGSTGKKFLSHHRLTSPSSLGGASLAATTTALLSSAFCASTHQALDPAALPLPLPLSLSASSIPSSLSDLPGCPNVDPDSHASSSDSAAGGLVADGPQHKITKQHSAPTHSKATPKPAKTHLAPFLTTPPACRIALLTSGTPKGSIAIVSPPPTQTVLVSHPTAPYREDKGQLCTKEHDVYAGDPGSKAHQPSAPNSRTAGGRPVRPAGREGVVLAGKGVVHRKTHTKQSKKERERKRKRERERKRGREGGRERGKKRKRKREKERKRGREGGREKGKKRKREKEKGEREREREGGRKGKRENEGERGGGEKERKKRERERGGKERKKERERKRHRETEKERKRKREGERGTGREREREKGRREREKGKRKRGRERGERKRKKGEEHLFNANSYLKGVDFISQNSPVSHAWLTGEFWELESTSLLNIKLNFKSSGIATEIKDPVWGEGGAYLDSVHRIPKNRIVKFDHSPEIRFARIQKVAPIFLQDLEGSGDQAEIHLELKRDWPFILGSNADGLRGVPRSTLHSAGPWLTSVPLATVGSYNGAEKQTIPHPYDRHHIPTGHMIPIWGLGNQQVLKKKKRLEFPRVTKVKQGKPDLLSDRVIHSATAATKKGCKIGHASLRIVASLSQRNPGRGCGCKPKMTCNQPNQTVSLRTVSLNSPLGNAKKNDPQIVPAPPTPSSPKLQSASKLVGSSSTAAGHSTGKAASNTGSTLSITHSPPQVKHPTWGNLFFSSPTTTQRSTMGRHSTGKASNTGSITSLSPPLLTCSLTLARKMPLALICRYFSSRDNGASTRRCKSSAFCSDGFWIKACTQPPPSLTSPNTQRHKDTTKIICEMQPLANGRIPLQGRKSKIRSQCVPGSHDPLWRPSDQDSQWGKLDSLNNHVTKQRTAAIRLTATPSPPCRVVVTKTEGGRRIKDIPPHLTFPQSCDQNSDNGQLARIYDCCHVPGVMSERKF
ncbi:Zinc finger CCCH domain-containing protein 13, partial [Ophiophagus hannah]